MKILKNLLFYFLNQCPTSIGLLTGLLHAIYSNPLNILRLFFYQSFTKSISSSTSSNSSINELKTLYLNNCYHSLLIRGRSLFLPIILFVHGGPGVSEIPYHSLYGQYLEESYIVIHYDQRLTGKSGYLNLKKYHISNFLTTITIEEHINDLISITKWIINNFPTAKNGIYLIGGSWGTILSLYAIKRYPKLYKKVILRGVVTNGPRSELLSWEYLVCRINTFNSFSTKEINEINKYKPPYKKEINRLLKQREYLSSLGGSDYSSFQSKERIPLWYLSHQIIYSLFNTNEMTLNEIIYAKECLLLSLEKMWPEVEQINMLDVIKEPFSSDQYLTNEEATEEKEEATEKKKEKEEEDLKCPILFIHGQHDYCTVHSLVEEFISSISCKEKYLIWFRHSG